MSFNGGSPFIGLIHLWLTLMILCNALLHAHIYLYNSSNRGVPMKRTFKTLILAAAMTTAAMVPSMAATVAEMQPSEISITGNATRTMAPTYASLSLGLTSSNPSVTVAKSANDRVMSLLISSLTNMGIAKKDIYTSNISVNPDYNYESGKRQVTGYSVSNTVTVRINDLNKVSQAVGAAVNAGATEINSLSFNADVSKDLNDQLTVDAIKDGRHKAEVMASALGRTLGPVKNVSTYEPQTSTPDSNGRLYKVAAPMMALSTSTPVEQGTLIVTKEANMTYYLQ